MSRWTRDNDIGSLIENTDDLLNHVNIFPFHEQDERTKSMILVLLENNPLYKKYERGLVEPSLDLFLLNEILKIKRDKFR